MEPKEKAKSIVSAMSEKIGESDFHVPSFITGVPFSNKRYKAILDEETRSLAKECALVCVDEILDGYRKILPSSREYWQQVKEEIEKL